MTEGNTMLKNHRSKAQLLSLASVLLLAFNLSASEAPKTNKKPQDRFEMMAQKLELTEKQKSDLKPMLEKLKTNRADTLKKLDEQEEKELASILKPEQVSQVSRYLKRSQRMSTSGGNREGMKKGNQEKRIMGNPAGQKNMYPRPPAKLPEKQ